MEETKKVQEAASSSGTISASCLASYFRFLDKKSICKQTCQPPFNTGDTVLACSSGLSHPDYTSAKVTAASGTSAYVLQFLGDEVTEIVPISRIRPYKRVLAQRRSLIHPIKCREVNKVHLSSVVNIEVALAGEQPSLYQATVLGRDIVNGTYCLDFGQGIWRENVKMERVRKRSNNYSPVAPLPQNIACEGGPTHKAGSVGGGGIHPLSIGAKVLARWKPGAIFMYPLEYDAKVIGINEDGSYCLNYGLGFWRGKVPALSVRLRADNDEELPLFAWNSSTWDAPGTGLKFS